MHKEIIIVYSRGVVQPSGIRRFGIGVSQLSEHTCDVASPTKKTVIKVATDAKEAQATRNARGSDMVARVTMQIDTAH